MKAKTISTSFTPITIEITIESKAELVELWSRINAAGCCIPARDCYECKSVPDWSLSGELWNELDDHLTGSIGMKQ